MNHLKRLDIERYSSGELPPAQRLDVKSHLSECKQCSEYLDSLEKVKQSLFDKIPPERLASEIIRRLEKPESDQSSSVMEGPKHRFRLIFAIAAAALVAVGTIGFFVTNDFGSTSTQEQETGELAQNNRASVVQILRAASDKRSGVSLKRTDSAEFVEVELNSPIEPGETIKTDSRTRARLELEDGTILVLNHQTELRFDETEERLFHVSQGEILADVVRRPGEPPLRLNTKTGQVEVIGTKLTVTATDDLSSVRVTRGKVRIHDNNGNVKEVLAGQEGLIAHGGGLDVAPALNLAGSVAWSNLESAENSQDVPIAGLGQLRARRPGEKQGRERPLSLDSHKVRVRIVGNIAYTEVEEVFRNDSNQTLEGIYRFPMPADAQISRLALEVEEVLEEGAFIAKDRASRIWRGVTGEATKRKRSIIPIITQEIFWMPGPWRDPALLEWQRGGQAQLRIFPIPAKSGRRVIIGYTQTLDPHGNSRRYVYPLAHSSDDSTKANTFEFDLRLVGADPDKPVRSHGYQMASSQDGNATQLKMSHRDFLPAGDVIVDYNLPQTSSEIRWWTYQGDVAVGPSNTTKNRGKNRSSPEVIEAQKQISQDVRPFVAFSIRPELPAVTEDQRQDLILVVDSSQSMIGERFSRAAELVTHLIAEMDRRDRFLLLSCDATCQSMADNFENASSQTARSAQQWLTELNPSGPSDMTIILRNVNERFSGSQDRQKRVIYIGDGIATVGHRRASSLASLTESMSQSQGISFTTVGIGGGSDEMALSAIARAGGGHYVPYIPGQRASSAALAVLETTLGSSLRDVEIELPEGITDIAPARFPTIRAGEELIVVGRFTGNISGDVVIRGNVGGESYEDQYPVELAVSTNAGNSFVPRLWASETIARLELRGRPEDRIQTIGLSKAFGVMSRDTALLVLESEAMFRAFGVDRVQHRFQWTGEEEAQSGESSGRILHGAAKSKSKSFPGMLGLRGSNGLEGYGGSDKRFSGLGTIGNGGQFSPAQRRSGNRGQVVSRVRSARPTVTGSLDPNVIRRHLARNRGRFRRVYERQLTRNPDLSGRVIVEFVISESGLVRAARIQSSTMGDPQLEQTLIRVIRSIRFPAPQGGSVTVRYPLVFHSQNRPNSPMKMVGTPTKVFRPRPQRFAVVSGNIDVLQHEQRALQRAEESLSENPDSRDRHRTLVRSLSRAGDIERAIEMAEAWIARDRMDPEAITALADLLGRSGQRTRAIQLLSGTVDLQPDNPVLHERLAEAFERSGDRSRACSHRIALSEIRNNDVSAVAGAVRCERELGHRREAEQLLDGLQKRSDRPRVEKAAGTAERARRVSGEIMVEAEWDGDEDLDLSLITPQGTRLSWMGGRRTVVGENSESNEGERLGLRRVWGGSYLIEISRTESAEGQPLTPIEGRVRVRALGTQRTFEFTLRDQRVAVGRITIRRNW